MLLVDPNEWHGLIPFFIYHQTPERMSLLSLCLLSNATTYADCKKRVIYYMHTYTHLHNLKKYNT